MGSYFRTSTELSVVDGTCVNRRFSRRSGRSRKRYEIDASAIVINSPNNKFPIVRYDVQSTDFFIWAALRLEYGP